MEERDTLHSVFMEGEELFHNGDEDGALEKWKECLRIKRGWKPAISRIIAVLRHKSLDNLLSFIDEVIGDVEGDYRNFLLTEKASALLSGGNYGECENLCRELINNGWRTSFVLKLYVRSLSAQGKWKEIAEFFKGGERIFDGLLKDLAIFHIKDPAVAEGIVLEGRGGFLLERWVKKWKGEVADFVERRMEEPLFKEMPFLIERVLYEVERDYEKGRDELLKWMELFPESLEILSIVAEVARVYGDRELLKGALYGLKKVLKFPLNAFLIEELVNLCEEDEPEEALKLMEELYSLSKTRDVFERMLTLAIKIGNYRKAGDLLKDFSNSLSGQEKVSALLDSAMWYDKSQDFESERSVLYMALECEPSNSIVLDRLEGVLFKLEDWDGLIEVYRKKIETSYDPKDLIMYSMKIGEVYENYKGDLEGASKAYEEVLEISPGYLPAIESMKRVEKKRGNWRKVIALNERLADLSSDGARISSLFWENGLFSLVHLNDVMGAIKSFERVLSVLPENREVIRILRALFIKAGDYSKAFDYLKMEMEMARPEETDYLFFEGAVIFLMNEDRNKALNILKRFLDKEGYRERVFYYLFSIYSQLERWDELLSVLKEISQTSEGDFKNFIDFLAGKILIEKLGRNDEGRKLLAKAVESGRGNWWSFLKVEEVLIKSVNLEELVELYERASERMPLLKEVYKEVISLLKYHIHGEKIEGENLPAKLWFGEYLLHRLSVNTDFLRKLYDENFPSEWIIEVALSILQEIDEKGRIALLRECIDMARTFGELSAIEGAVFETRDDELISLFLLKKKGLGFVDDSEYLIASNVEARMGRIEEALKYLDEYIALHGNEIYPLSVKASLLKRADRWNEAVEVMERWSELEGLEGKRKLLEECAQIYLNKLNLPQRALKIYETLNGIFPGEEKYLDNVLSTCELVGDYHSYMRCVQATIDAIDSYERKSELSLKAGKVIEEKAGLEDKAVEFYRASFNFLKSLKPLEELERIFRKREDFSTLVEILNEKVNLVDDSERGAIYGEAGHIYLRKLGEIQKAEERFEKALLYTFPEGYSSDLIEVRLVLKDVEKLKEAVDRVVENLKERENLQLLLEVSRFFLDGGEFEYAEKVLKHVLDIDGNNETALSNLVELYRREKRWDEFIRMGERLASILKARDRDEASSLYNELGVIARDEMVDYETSVDLFKKSLEVKKDFVEARKNLADILIELKRDKEAYEECRKVLLAEPLRTKTLHFMAYYYEKERMPDKAFCTVEVLNLIGEMDDKMEKVIWEVSSNKRRLPQGTFSPSLREKLVHHDENGSFNELFEIIGSYMFSLYGMSPSNLGMSKEAQVSPKMSHPVKNLLEEVALFFGIKDFNLYISDSFKTEVIVPAVSPLSVVVGSKVAKDLKEDALRYIIAKKVEMALRGYACVDILDDGKIYDGVVAFLSLSGGGFSPPSSIDQKAVTKAIPWLQRGNIVKRIGDVANKLKGKLSREELSKHLRAVRKSAGRVALFLSKGLKNAVEGEVYFSSGKKSIDDIVKMVQENEYLFDIFRFYSTDTFFFIRDKLGLSVA